MMDDHPPLLNKLADKRVLVTGAAGFIGSHMIPRLVECGASVIATATELGWQPWVTNLVQEGRIAFVSADVLTTPGLAQIIPYLKNIDFVIHMARVWAQGKSSLELAIDEISRNLLGTVRFLSVVSESGAGIVYPSSVEVYGVPERLPLCEDHPLRPASPYAVAKAAAEGFLKVHALKNNVSISVLRYSTVYGPGELEPRAVPNFIRAALKHMAPLIDGNGLDIRDYVYVGDVVDATLRALVSAKKGFRVYNIGSGIGHTTTDLARLIIDLTNARLMPEYRASDRIPVEIVCDISKAHDELGYSPAYPLERGLSIEIGWFQENSILWK